MKANPKTKENPNSSDLDKLVIEKIGVKEAVPLPTLVTDLSKDLSYSTDRVTEGLMALQSRKTHSHL